MKQLCLSTETNKIRLMTVRRDKSNPNTEIAIGTGRDCTNEALAAVFHWFIGKMNESGGTEKNKPFELRYQGQPFVLKMERE